MVRIHSSLMIINSSFSLTYGIYMYAMWAMLLLTMYGAYVSLYRGNEYTTVAPQRITSTISHTRGLGQRIPQGSKSMSNASIRQSSRVGSMASEISRIFTEKNLVAHLIDWATIWGVLIVSTLVCEHFNIFGQTNSIVYNQTSLTVTLSVILIFLNIICLITSKKTISAVVINVEIASLWILSTIGGLLVLSCTDNISLYLSLELQSFCFVVLCLIKSDSPYCIEAAMKYFLLSALASLFLLLGTSYMYSVVGTTNLFVTAELLAHSELLRNNIYFSIGVWMVLIGLLWKLASAPMHFWAADVYQGCPAPVSLAISTSPKLALFGFWIFAWQPLVNYTNLIPSLSRSSQEFSPEHLLSAVPMSHMESTGLGVLAFFSAVSMLIGAICALGQVHIKRLLAYSSINHTGLLLIPICSGISFFFSSSILLVHFMLYLITNILVWSLVMWPIVRRSQND